MKAIIINQRFPLSARFVILALSLGLVGALAGCGETSKNRDNADSDAPRPHIEELFVADAPQGARSVTETRKMAEAGASVTVVGRVAGAEEPFSPYYATLVLVDENLTTCEQRPGDSCRTPWDACCEEPDTIAGSRISVQVVGEDGHPVEQSLKGIRGLSELDTLVVSGTVAEGSTAENVILNAMAIYRQDS